MCTLVHYTECSINRSYLNYYKVDFVSLKTIINDINLTNRVQACENNDDKWECFHKTIADGVIHSGLARRKSAVRNRKQ